MKKEIIEQRILAGIQPQLDRADELLDHYLKDAPPEVWEPIAFQVAVDHYSNQTVVNVAANFDGPLEKLREIAQKLAIVSKYGAFYRPVAPISDHLDPGKTGRFGYLAAGVVPARR